MPPSLQRQKKILPPWIPPAENIYHSINIKSRYCSEILPSQLLLINMIIQIHNIRSFIPTKLLPVLPIHPVSTKIRCKTMPQVMRREMILQPIRTRIMQAEPGRPFHNRTINGIFAHTPAIVTYKKSLLLRQSNHLPALHPIL